MKTIVWDLDGTLLDSRSRHTTLLWDLCMELQINIAETKLMEYLPCKCNGMSTYQYLTEHCGISDKAALKCSALWTERIEKWDYLSQDILYPDSKKTLSALNGRFSCFLITARQHENLMRNQLKVNGIELFFDNVICVSPINAPKNKVLAAKGLKEVACWVGDTEVDSWAAQQLGCNFYALYRGFRSQEFWMKSGIKSHSNLSELINYLGG